MAEEGKEKGKEEEEFPVYGISAGSELMQTAEAEPIRKEIQKGT